MKATLEHRGGHCDVHGANVSVSRVRSSGELWRCNQCRITNTVPTLDPAPLTADAAAREAIASVIEAPATAPKLPSGWAESAREEDDDDVYEYLCGPSVWGPREGGLFRWARQGNQQDADGSATSLYAAMAGALGLHLEQRAHEWLCSVPVGENATRQVHGATADKCAWAACEAFYAAHADQQSAPTAPESAPENASGPVRAGANFLASADAAPAPPPAASSHASAGAGVSTANPLLALTSRAVDVSERALKHYGRGATLDKAIEECAELIVVLRHSESPRRTVPLEDIASEVADVFVMALRLRAMYGAEVVDKAIEYKLARLEKRMSEEEPVADDGDRWCRRIKALEAQLEQVRAVLR